MAGDDRTALAGAVIAFDLDGTLVDTAPDLIGTLNWLLADCLWEGVVWHGPDGQMAKLKVRDALAYVKAQETAVAS